MERDGEEGRTGADRASEPFIDVIEEWRQGMISAECKHHTAIRRHGKQATMPHTKHDQGHQCLGTWNPKHVDQDLQDGLAEGRGDRVGEILDGEEIGQDEKEAEDGGAAHRHQNAHWGTPGCVSRFLR